MKNEELKQIYDASVTVCDKLLENNKTILEEALSSHREGFASFMLGSIMFAAFVATKKFGITDKSQVSKLLHGAIDVAMDTMTIETDD